MNRILQLVLLIVFVFLFKGIATAQGGSSFKKHRYHSIGFSVNAMNYVGELDPGPSFLSPGIKFTRPNFGVTYLKRLQPRYSLRANVSWGRLKGDDYQNASFNDKDINRKMRNLSFRSSILEIKVDVVVDLWENRGRHTKRPDYTPYAFLGIAYFHHNPKTLYQGSWVALQPLKTEGKSYSLNQVAFPMGLGFRYKLGKQWDLAFEMGWRFTLTDYLDDVSKSYADKSTLGSQAAKDLSDRSGELFANAEMAPYITNQGGFIPDNNTANGNPGGTTPGYRINGYGAAGDQRGDSNRDWYIISGFHLTYIIPGRVICPKFRTFNNKLQQKLLAYQE
ncbi:MAG: hypothetical protein K2X86_13910 [Cytophagaceae bacterium]|nr:hypothetical protein [Cytophagaceae bacterium]